MISLWYPARRSGDARRAPYLQSQLADYYVDSPPAGLPTGHIDWSATATNATPLAEALPRAGGYPVVLYSPGGGNSRALGTVLAEELASHGFVVVTVDHTHETAVAFPGGRLEVSAIPANPPDINAAKQLFMDSREADILFVLDQLNMIADGENPDADGTPLPAGLTGALNPAAMGMYGHPAGGVTAARAVRDDDRLLAGINMEGFFEFGENHPELGGHDPFLLMGARSNPDYPPLLGEPRTHRTDPLWQEFWSHCTGYRLDLNVPDGRHYTYTDLQWWLPQLAAQLGIGSDQVAGLIGTVEPGGIIAAERAYVTGRNACWPDRPRGSPRCGSSGDVARRCPCRPADRQGHRHHLGYLLSPSCGTDAGTDGLTRLISPLSTHARWLGAKRGESSPSLISRVTATRLYAVAGKYSRSLDWPPSEVPSRSASTASTMPS